MVFQGQWAKLLKALGFNPQVTLYQHQFLHRECYVRMAFSARAQTTSREGSSKATTQRPCVEKGAAGHTWERAFHTEQQYKAHAKKMVRAAQ